MNADEGTQTEDQDTTEDPYLSNTALVSLALRSALRTSLHDIRLPRSLWSDFKIKIEAYLLERSLPLFQHTRLMKTKSIRLLTLGDGSTRENGRLLRISLQEHDMGSLPAYTALSYKWDLDVSHRRMFFCYYITKDTVDYAKRIIFKAANPNRESRRRPIICNGKLLYITPNLFHALKRLPQQKGQLWWIDAICINQGDDIEKSFQVNQMGQIFSNAKQVHVWLGKANAFTRNGPSFMSSLPSLAGDTDERSLRYRQWLLYDLDPSVQVPKYFSRWLAIVLIFKKGWFRRIWVLQEALLAADLNFQLGGQTFKKECLIRALEWLMFIQSHNPVLKIFARPLQLLDRSASKLIQTLERQNTLQQYPTWRLEDYMAICRGRESTDKRDMVFAGISLLRNVHSSLHPSSGLEADYTRSTLEVYQRFTQALLCGNMGLDVISLCGGTTKNEDERLVLPSWVVDLSIDPKPGALRSLGNAGFKTCILSDDCTQFAVSGKTLQVKAIRLDQIIALGEENCIFKTDSYLPEPDGLVSILLRLPKVYMPTGEASMTAFWRTILANFYEGSYPAPDNLSESFIRWYFKSFVYRLQNFNETVSGCLDIEPDTKPQWPLKTRSIIAYAQQARKSLADFRKVLKIHDSVKNPLIDIWTSEIVGDSPETFRSPDSWSYGYNRFFTACSSYGIHKRIFLTKNGYLGLGPSTIREGDTVMLVPGTHVPHIFRKSSDSVRTSNYSSGVSSDVERSSAMDRFQHVKGSLRTRDHILPRDNIRMSSHNQRHERIVQHGLGHRFEGTSNFVRDKSSLLDGFVSDTLSQPTDLSFSDVSIERWSLVGEAYVHGIMHGEAVQYGDLKTELIDIV